MVPDISKFINHFKIKEVAIATSFLSKKIFLYAEFGGGVFLAKDIFPTGKEWYFTLGKFVIKSKIIVKKCTK